MIRSFKGRAINLRNLWNKGYSYNYGQIQVKSFPSIRIEPTNACMMNCKMCPRRYMKRKVGFMNIQFFEKILSQLKFRNQSVTLHHIGDPLLHPEIGEMIKIAHKYGFRAGFSTNPISLTDKNIGIILKNHLDFILISLDGATKATLEKIRGKNANYEKSIQNLNNFIAEKVRRKLKKPITTVSIILMKETEKETEKEIADFKMKWNVQGVDDVLVKHFIRWEGTMKEINKLAKDTQLVKSHDKEQDFPCFWPWNKIVVYWDGRVVPCCCDSDAKSVLGDLNKQTLAEIWNGPKMKQFRKEVIKNRFPKGHICESCHEKEGIAVSKSYPFNIILKKGLKIKDYLKYD